MEINTSLFLVMVILFSMAFFPCTKLYKKNSNYIQRVLLAINNRLVLIIKKNGLKKRRCYN
jgi:hypothetical protein